MNMSSVSRLASSVLALVAAADCSDGKSDRGGVGPVEGVRLQPWEIEAEGAPPLRAGIFDTQEKAHCRFLHDRNGELRCLPDAPPTLAPLQIFADPSCQQLVWSARRAEAMAVLGRPVALPTPRQTCAPQRYEVRRLRALPDDHGRFIFDGTTCASSHDPVIPTGIPTLDMTVDETLAPDRWQRGSEVDGPWLSDRLHVREVATGDGARFVDHLVDDRWGQSCTLSARSGSVGCWPASIQSLGGFFTDAACTTPLFWAHGCPTPAFIEQSASELFALDARWTGPLFYGAKGCNPRGQATTDETGDRYYLRGARLGSDAVATVSADTEGTGTLQLRGLRDRSGAFVPLPAELAWFEASPYFDAVANEDCQPIWTVEGAVRCVPASVIVLPTYDYYGDAACTRPVYFDSISDSRDKEVVRMTTDASGRPVALGVFAVARLPAKTGIFESSTGTCRQVGGDVEGMAEFGRAISWDRFPAFKERNGRPPGTP